MVYRDTDENGKLTGRKRIVIPSFDLHSREVEDDRCKDRVSTIVYELRYKPFIAIMLKNLL